MSQLFEIFFCTLGTAFCTLKLPFISIQKGSDFKIKKRNSYSFGISTDELCGKNTIADDNNNLIPLHVIEFCIIYNQFI